MPKVNFLHDDGTSTTVDGDVGDSVMYIATSRDVKGIEAECGGFCNCATCHVYVDEAWFDRLVPMAEHENELLDGTVAERRPTSRLSCQITLTSELDGITMTTPDRQT